MAAKRRKRSKKEEGWRHKSLKFFGLLFFVLFVPFCGKLLLLKCGADLVPVEALDLGGGHAGEGFFG